MILDCGPTTLELETDLDCEGEIAFEVCHHNEGIAFHGFINKQKAVSIIDQLKESFQLD